MTAVEVRPSEPTANFREPTTVVVELDDGLTDDDWSVDSPTAGLAEVARLDWSSRPSSRLLVIDLRKSKDAPDPGTHRITILIRRDQALHATVDIPVTVVEPRRCLAIAGAVPKFIVNADGSVTLRLTIFNRCGASASVDLRASVGRKGIDIHAPAVSIGPGEFGIIDPKLTFDTGDFVDLVAEGQLPNDFGLSISTKGSIGGEIRLTAKDFTDALNASLPPPDPPPTPEPTPGPLRWSTFAKVAATAVGAIGVGGLIWVGSQLPSESNDGLATDGGNAADSPGELQGAFCYYAPANGIAFYGETPVPADDDPTCQDHPLPQYYYTPDECWDAYVEWYEQAVESQRRYGWDIHFPERPCGRDALDG